jgi:glyoxylase-like metal-dependent hydrolase (beta-lactamase superfamily II)
VKELLPGLHHYTAFHEGIRSDVSSYFVSEPRVLIDPMLPPDGLEWFRGDRESAVILLTNRHHLRKSDAFAKEFGCPIRCHESGLYEFENGPAVEGFAFGDELAPGITALEMGAICPDDSVLRIDVGGGALAFADGIIHEDGVGFVPDRYMGDDPDAVKSGVRESVRRLLDQDFDTALFAHGDPIVGGAKKALRAFLAE